MLTAIAVACLVGMTGAGEAPLSRLHSPAEYRLVRRFEDFPTGIRRTVLNYFAAREARRNPAGQHPPSRELLIADPGRVFQETDIVEHDKPVRRFVFGGVGPEPFVFYEHGGIGLHSHVLFLVRDGAGFRIARNFSFSLGGRPNPSSVDDLWRELRRSPVRDAMNDDA